MQSIDLIRDNLNKSTCRDMRAQTMALLESLSEDDLDSVSAKAPDCHEETFGTYRLCLQFVADHWYMHRGQLADSRRVAGLDRMWLLATHLHPHQARRAEEANSFVATLPGGSLCGVRAPMHELEKPIVRTYLRVTDIDAAVAEAGQLGAEIALEPMEIPGQGQVAIYRLGGIEQGLWQVPDH